jgi:hypothetical protein
MRRKSLFFKIKKIAGRKLIKMSLRGGQRQSNLSVYINKDYFASLVMAVSILIGFFPAIDKIKGREGK